MTKLLFTTFLLFIAIIGYAQSDFQKKADSLYNAMLYFTNEEDYTKAIKAQEQLVELLKSSGQKEIYTNQISVLAILYVENEEYKKAVKAFTIAIENIRQIWGTQLEFLGQNYLGLSVCQITLKNYDEGIIAYKHADTIFRSVEIEDIDTYLDAIHLIRGDLLIANKYNEAELKIAEREVEIAKKRYGIYSIHYARVLSDVGNSFLIIGEHDLAYKYLKEAYKFYELRKLELPSEYIEIASDISQYYFQIGDYETSLSYLLKGKELSISVEGEKSIESARIFNQIGKVYFEMGRYALAEENMIKAINTLELTNNTDKKSYVRSIFNLARLYNELGNNKKALNYAWKAERALDKVSEDYIDYDKAKIKEGLSILYTKMGWYDKAKQKIIEAIDIQKNLLGDNNFELANIYVNLGQIYFELDNIDSVTWCLNKSIAILEKAYTPQQFGYEKVLNHKKYIYYFSKQYDSVAIMAERSVELVENTVGKKHPDYRAALFQLAEAYAKINHPKTSEYIKQTIAEDRRQLRNKLTFLSGDELLEFISEQLYEANRLLAYQTSKETILSGDLFNHLLLLKGASLQYSNTILQTVKNSDDTVLLKTYNRLTALKKLLAIEQAKADSKYNLLDLEVKADELEKKLVKKTSAFRSLDELFSYDWQNLQKQLKPNEVAIEFVRYDEWLVTQEDTIRYGALLLKKQGAPKYIPLFKEEQLKAILAKVSPKQLFKTRSNELLGEIQATPANYGDTLYQLVWQPLEKYLEGTKTIYLSPDGLLHQIAFNALSVNDSTLLIDKYQLLQLLSLKALANQSKKTKLKSIALFGGLEYDSENVNVKDSSHNLLPEDRGTTSSFSYLQGTLNETQSIKKLLKRKKTKATLYSGEAGTEEQFKQLSGKAPQILHLATHGFFIENRKRSKNKGQFSAGENAFTVASDPLMRGGLIFSGGNRAWQGLPTPKGKEDGVLTGYEVAGMDLSNTQLVVLSACQTGLGKVQGTEGVFGLQRAFKMAGVNQLIMSLWSVPDKETQELMELFYKELIKTKNTRTAFTNAQKIMREKYAPYYWAAFVLVE
jgi:CHAT domain-containing protein/tetratricopeptide (TPR) repeat protein